MSRCELISRKNQVRRQIEQLQERLQALQSEGVAEVSPGAGGRFQTLWRRLTRATSRGEQTRVRQIENRLEKLRAEEYRLRNAIDQSR